MVNFLGERISQQSAIVALAGIVLSVVVLFLNMSTVGLTASLMTLTAFFLYAYNVNCTIVGKCHVWSWVLTVLYVVNASTLLLGALVMENRN